MSINCNSFEISSQSWYILGRIRYPCSKVNNCSAALYLIQKNNYFSHITKETRRIGLYFHAKILTFKYEFDLPQRLQNFKILHSFGVEVGFHPIEYESGSKNILKEI